MEITSLDSILSAVKGTYLKKGNLTEFTRVCIDSRKVQSGDIFFAIKGENFDGHAYVQKAIELGVKLCIVHKKDILSEIDEKSLMDDVSIILVEDTKKALMDLAGFYRKTLGIKVIGITGSTGKTSTKDMLAAMLGSKYKVFKTKGNFNNEIGMPLMIFDLDKSFDIAVLEMGMSNFHEIERLAAVACPDIAIITNVGMSHIENLKTRENILKAKMEIAEKFTKENVLVVNGDNDLLQTVSNKDYKIIKIGTNSDYNFVAHGIIIDSEKIKYDVLENGNEVNTPININVPGVHNVLNSLLGIAVCRELGLSYEEITKGLSSLEFTSMRLDTIQCDKFTIINDAYNASPDSMEAALKVLNTYEGRRKVAVLGTMKELGDESPKAHKSVGEMAAKENVDLLITCGEFNEDFKEGFMQSNNEGKFIACDNIEDALQCIKENLKENDVVLVKASRSMKFENIVHGIQRIII